MSKRELQTIIRENEGVTLSVGTGNLNHLLASAHDLIVRMDLKGNPYRYIQNKPFRQEIRDVFKYTQPDAQKNLKRGFTLWDYVYHDDAEIADDGEAHRVWDEVENYFQSISPSGFWFGSHPGDGSDIGWHPNSLLDGEDEA